MFFISWVFPIVFPNFSIDKNSRLILKPHFPFITYINFKTLVCAILL
uniref:Uncharacterized protein n=1 Tax=Daphnia magna TaxID=35525 RepID=A0A0P5YB94_9CRUS